LGAGQYNNWTWHKKFQDEIDESDRTLARRR
jgi:hypothetical protein